MELLEAMQKRRSHRAYEKKSVDRKLIEELVQAAQYAPVSCNLQLTQFVVIDDSALLEKLRVDVSYKFGYAPVCIVVLYDPRFTVEHQSAVMTAGMQVQNMLLRATDLGLSAIPMAGFKKDPVIKELLGIPHSLELLLLVAVGYSTDVLRAVPKLPLYDTYRFNTYEGLRVLNGSVELGRNSVRDVIEYRSRIAPVYLDRFRLRVYDDSYYQAVMRIFSTQVLGNSGKRVLDLMTYDGMFIKLLREQNPDLEITASDYVANNLDFFRDKLEAKALRITDRNSFEHEVSSDIVSFVFQAHLVPELPVLLKSARETLVDDGIFVAAFVEEWFLKRTIKQVRNILRNWRMPVNVYEGNPFYRFGPYASVSPSRFRNYMKSAGFRSESQHIENFRKRGVRVIVQVYRKVAV